MAKRGVEFRFNYHFEGKKRRREFQVKFYLSTLLCGAQLCIHLSDDLQFTVAVGSIPTRGNEFSFIRCGKQGNKNLIFGANIIETFL